MHAHDHSHDLKPHPCPRTGKCCGRCKLAVPGRAAQEVHSSPKQIEPAREFILVHDFAD